MAGNIVYQDANQLTLTVPSGIESGDVLVYGNQPCVALTDRGANIAGKSTLKFNGAVEVELTGASEEDAVYINATTFALSLSDDGSSIFFGTCITDADADDMVVVRIGGQEPGAGS